MKKYKNIEIDIDKVKVYENNAKIHTEAQIQQIANSIDRFGFTNPLLIDENNNLIAGHGRLSAVHYLNVSYDRGIKKLPAIVVTGLSEADRRALVIIDNKLGENAQWNNDLLFKELEFIQNNSDIDMLDFGFTDSELREIVTESEEEMTPTITEKDASDILVANLIYKTYRIPLTFDEAEFLIELVEAHKAKFSGILNGFVKDYLMDKINIKDIHQ